MRRIDSTNLLRLLLSAVIALASIGPQGTYAHSHSASADGHHEHHDHDDEDHAAHEEDHTPTLSGSLAHVHGSWFGFPIVLPSVDGSSLSESGQFLSACPTLSGDLGKELSGPLKERVPWPSIFLPPEQLCLSPHESLLAPYHLAFGARTSHALAGRTLVLRC